MYEIALRTFLAQRGVGTRTSSKSAGIFISMSYAIKLKDPRWQKKRLEIMKRDDFKCKSCSASDKQLHVHHNYYEYGIEIWDYDDDCYETLCYDCHFDTTMNTKDIKSVLKKAKFRRHSELRNLIVMSEHLTLDELVLFRKNIVELLKSKGVEIEDGTSF